MESRRPPTRRNVLQVLLVSLLGGCLGAAPNATGPRRPPTPPADRPRHTPDRPDLYVSTFDYAATDGGNLRVFGEVANRGGVERVGTVRVRVKLDGETYVRERSVTVAPGGAVEFSATFEVSVEAFERGGGLDVAVA